MLQSTRKSVMLSKAFQTKHPLTVYSPFPFSELFMHSLDPSLITALSLLLSLSLSLSRSFLHLSQYLPLTDDKRWCDEKMAIAIKLN